MLGKTGGDVLRSIVADAKSGDPANKERTAARLYSESYMPDTTRQEDNTVVNSALNCGYSIMRGSAARYLTSYGFLCAVGVYHRNKLNAFNLCRATSWKRFALRIVNWEDAAAKHQNRLKEVLPPDGSARFLQITDRQYASMKILAGAKTRKEKVLDSRQTLIF